MTNLVLEKGKEIPTHDSPYAVVVGPVKGKIVFSGTDFLEKRFILEQSYVCHRKNHIVCMP